MRVKAIYKGHIQGPYTRAIYKGHIQGTCKGYMRVKALYRQAEIFTIPVEGMKDVKEYMFILSGSAILLRDSKAKY